jgi:hypothetical protein
MKYQNHRKMQNRYHGTQITWPLTPGLIQTPKKSGGVKPVLWVQTTHPSEMMRSYKLYIFYFVEESYILIPYMNSV